MSESTMQVTRRKLFVGGAAGTVALAGLASQSEAAAAPMTATEKANAKLVTTHLHEWGQASVDPEKLGQVYAEDCVLRLEEGKPPIMGRAAAVQAFKAYMADGSRFKIEVLETFAKGPLVANSRIDTVAVPGKPSQAFPVAGVFIVKDGKIKEWSDYLAAETPQKPT